MIQGIENFEMINGGKNGIKANTVEVTYRGNFASVDEVKGRRCKLPVPSDLRQKVDGLKYYFLSLTRHWNPSWTEKYLTDDHKQLKDIESSDKEYLFVVDLWERTRVNKVKINDLNFKISGDIEVIDGKRMGLSTVSVSEEDNYDFFDTVHDYLNDLCGDVIRYLQSDEYSLEAAKKFLLERYGDDDSEGDRIEKQDEDMTRKEMVELLEREGAIVMMSQEQERKLLGEKDDVKVAENKSDIGNDRYVEEDDVVDEEEDDDVVDEEKKEDDNDDVGNEEKEEDSVNQVMDV